MKLALVVLLVIVAVVGSAGYWYVARLTVEPVPVVAAQETERRVETGSIVGFVEPNGTSAWLGIPFARPPVGDLRWRAPLPPERWSGTRDALSFASACVQRGFGGSFDILGDEDCLYLNVWSPRGVTTNLPVLVWIHGGANHIGEAGSVLYSGGNLAAVHELVVVTINYRLGPLGWLTHPGLRASGDARDDSGNYGTLDIVRALEWVQDNISVFNGNPDNVTIFGESAGGFNVLTMMVSPLAAGLYHKAIVQSGGLDILPFSDAENFADDVEPGSPNSSRELINALLVAEGKAIDRDTAKTVQLGMTDPEIAGYLRSKSAAEILKAQDGSILSGTPYIYGDGFVLPRDKQVDEIFGDVSSYNATPVVLGTNRDEVKLFMAMWPDSTERLFGVPYRLKNVAAYDRDARYGSDAWKVRAVDSIATRLRASQGGSVYAYRFDWDELRSVLTLDLAQLLGAAHGLEIPFVFGNFDQIDRAMVTIGGNVPARDALSGSMMSYWAEFAYSGNPGRGRDGAEVAWKSWQNGSESNERLLILDSSDDGGIRMSTLRLTLAELRTRLISDTTFATQEEHCQAYTLLFPDEAFDQVEYSTLGVAGCATP